MKEIVIISICILAIIASKIAWGIKIKELRTFKDKQNKKLDEITKKLPDNKTVCREILERLDNQSNVAIKEDDETANCLYMVFNNTILLGKFKADFIRIQTIAHECLHSIQNKVTLWFNYLFSIVYLLYFYITTILTIFNIIGNTNIHIIILLVFSFLQYAIRSYLETDAMTKAPYIAKDYLTDKQVSSEDIGKIMAEYKEINSVGIPFVNFELISKNILRVIIYCICILV